MKATPLTDLLQKIPTLPYNVMADPVTEGLHPYHDQRFIVTADAVVDYNPRYLNEWTLTKGSCIASMRDVPVGTAAYLVHASNVLPELVEALRDLLEDLQRCGQDFPICSEILGSSYGEAAKAALNKATNIPTA